MTNFKWVGPDNFRSMDLWQIGVLQNGELLMYGKIIDIPDTPQNKLLIERLKRPQEPNFEVIEPKTIKTKKKEDKKNE